MLRTRGDAESRRRSVARNRRRRAARDLGENGLAAIGITGLMLAAMLLGAALVVILRLLAAHYRWSLPKSDYSADQTQSAR